MKFLGASIALAVATTGAVNAQTSPDFPVKVATNLRAEFQDSSIDVSPPGVTLTQNDVANIPTVQGPKDSSRTVTYLLFVIDEDFNSGGTRVPFLQFFQPNLAGASEVLFADPTAVNFTATSSASYIPPSPPRGDGPHRYNMLLYFQPKDFQVPSAYSSFFPPASNSARLGFDMDGFAKAAGIGDPVLGNWFQVQNGQAVSMGSSSTPASTTTTTFDSTSESTSSEEPPSTSSLELSSEPTTTPDSTFSTAISTESPGPFASGSNSQYSTTSSMEAPTTTVEPSIAPSSSSASATLGASSPNAAGVVEIRNGLKALIVGFMLFIVGLEVLR